MLNYFQLLPLALTCGDPASISAELTIKAWIKKKYKNIPPFFYIGDANHIQYISNLLHFNIPIKIIKNIDEVNKIFWHSLPILHQNLTVKSILGQPDSSNALPVIKSIETAVKLIQNIQCRGIVTNAIAKNILYDIKFKHPGHTEFLEYLSNKNSFKKIYKSVMMLVCNKLRVVPITIHIPLMKVSEKLTINLIYNTAKIVSNDLKKWFNIHNIKMVFAGLNPHAGEFGTIGNEDIKIIIPAINRLIKDGFNAKGPLPADTMFYEKARKKYDVAFGMYHDQVLIPIKTLDFNKGVNITLGLPFIRTSPSHGTGFDIAKKGIACPNSLISALKIAHKMSINSLG